MEKNKKIFAKITKKQCLLQYKTESNPYLV